MRKLPELARLRALLRRGPIARVAVGTALLVPSVALLSTSGFEGLKPTKLVQAPAVDPLRVDPMAEQWGARVMEEQRKSLIADLASAFEVPLSLATQIHDAAIETKIEPNVAFGLVAAESSFRPSAVSPVGAIGLTQVMPATARDVEPGTSRKELFDTQTNLRIGFSYLRKLMDKYQGDTELALTAYNRGPGTVDRVLKRGGNPDNGYADKVLTGESERHVALMNRKFGRR